MSESTDDLVKTIKKPFEAVYDFFDKLPGKKTEHTDMHQKRVEYANKTFRDAAEKEEAAKKKKLAPPKKKVGGGSQGDTQIKTIKKSAPAKKYAVKR